jgi:hypothetical protein
MDSCADKFCTVTMNSDQGDFDEILSAEIVASPQEIITEFWESCAEAAACHNLALPKLKQATAALVRLLDRSSPEPQSH